MADKYDAAIEYLTAAPEQIHMAWIEPNEHPAGALFLFATKSGRPEVDQNGRMSGCITSVHNRTHHAATPELTEAIRADERIPQSTKIAVYDLPVLAEWQRRIDRELERE